MLRGALATLCVWAGLAATAACGGPQRVGPLASTVDYNGLWFADVECAKRFAMPRVIRSSDVDALARCIETLDLQPSKRRTVLPDGAVFTYGGGLEVAARYRVSNQSRVLIAIGFSGGARPTISPDALEAHRIAGHRDPVLDEVQQAAVMATIVAPRKRAVVLLRVCIDERGAVSSVVPLISSTPELVGLLDALSDWRFRPFVWNGEARGVCVLVERAYPAPDKPEPGWVPFATEEAPFPAVMNAGVTQEQLRGLPTPTRLMGAHALPLLVTAVRFCVDTAGRVSAVKVIERSGTSFYDDAVARHVSSWSVTPFLVGGQPTRVCSYAVFGIRSEDQRSMRSTTRLK